MIGLVTLYLVLLLSLVPGFQALRYDPQQVSWNLNEATDAEHPLDYAGKWDNHSFYKSPSNWRFPFYVLTVDRYIDGDPTNNEANGTAFENEWLTNQYRFGGDVKGLKNHLDYIQGAGFKALYLAGSPFINMPWSGDGYGPLDLTLLDHHHGVIQEWRDLIDEIHARGMYVIMDNTMATMGDLLAFEGYVNATAPFSWHEYDVIWKTSRRYHDFEVNNNDEDENCEWPAMWSEDGYPYSEDALSARPKSCKNSDFDAFGDMKGVGAVPVYQSQLSKFASVQDRLRGWKPSVLAKLNHFSCLQISMLDIDGFRMDKALQSTVDAQASFSQYQKECARNLNKDNFLIVGESVGEIPLAAIYFGRGMQPNQSWANGTEAMLAGYDTEASHYLRDTNLTALDGAAFHYPTYGALTRFLGLDGPIGFEGVDFVDHWQKLLQTDDMVNWLTGEFDPRHMFGTTNQDVFRWPSLANGTERQILGSFIVTIEMPGIPMVLWGEEQQFYILENLASDYVFGRTPMGSSSAWQLHGCYQLGEEVYVDMPFDSAKSGCHDQSVSYNHLDPSHPLRNIYKRMFEMRQQYPTLNDGYYLETLSTQIRDVYLPGSGGLPSPTGMWSVYRGRQMNLQDFTEGQGNQGVWLVFSNDNHTVDYKFDCSNATAGLISPFPANTTVKNLFYPYEEIVLESSTVSLGIEGSTEVNGCLSNMTMRGWGFKAFVPKDNFTTPAPTITRFVPGHDARLQSNVSRDSAETVNIELHFSREMHCDSLISTFSIQSTTESNQTAQLDKNSVKCNLKSTDSNLDLFAGEVGTEWVFTGQLTNVYNGVHAITIDNATTEDQGSFTNARDTFIFRIGQTDNPIVFPWKANYTTEVLFQNADTQDLYVSHKAAGADMWRYSLTFGSSWSNWTDYVAGNVTLDSQSWSGTKTQAWDGHHVVLQYWSEKGGGSDHMQHGDLQTTALPRRWPHVHIQGPWNQYGYDAGLEDEMELTKEGWKFELTSEWPTRFIANVWGMDPDGVPDKTKAYGDVDGDHVLDLVPPDSLSLNVINVTVAPGMPHTAWTITINDGTYRYSLERTGSAARQIMVFFLLAFIPIFTGCAAVFAFYKSFYQVKHNKIGIVERVGIFGKFKFKSEDGPLQGMKLSRSLTNLSTRSDVPTATGLTAAMGDAHRRTVLIATMEYEIEDWNIRIKIGGLGVMANLMGKNLGHQNLIWVVPCAGGIDYPVDQEGEPMTVTVLGKAYHVSVQYHVVRNITYVLLDAPVFRQQTKAEPYPARMDDLDSAVYYSAWNACIAEAIKRFPMVDLYHINDYHGALAPLYLLPRVIPCCLSLHNAEFQGLWPIRDAQELDEVSRVFNLPEKVIQDYVQFGEVFNLLHAGASYLRIHQKGFGAVGVSKKYGKRSLARYPIFWGLSKIGALPNPDPSDTAEWNKSMANTKDVELDFSAEATRGELRMEAQKWAGLNVDPKAELFVFVGRWSMQKGVDCIADVFPAILEKHKSTQLICVGPVIDLYGKFAALKLAKLMKKYPGRVFSKPEFTQLPPFIFSGAEFALIPSRDEPFGLVAVEFGRKGALGVGARVGGLGQMPGFWFTIESTSTKHLLRQFKSAIDAALSTSQETRAEMRARSSLQRFPVAQWVEDLEKLQSLSINKHRKVAGKKELYHDVSPSGSASTATTAANTPANSRPGSRATSPTEESGPSFGQPFGPGHDEHGRPRARSISRNRPRANSAASTISLPRPIYDNGMSQRIRGQTRDAYERPPSLSTYPDSPQLNLNDPMIQHNLARFGGHIANGPHGNHPHASEWMPHPYGNYPQISSPLAVRPTSESVYEEDFVPQPLRHSKSLLSLHEVKNTPDRPSTAATTATTGAKSFKLENVDPFFTDSTGLYYNRFDKMLDSLEASNSESKYCIEDYLNKSEKDWFNRFHDAKLGKSRPGTPDSQASTAYEPGAEAAEMRNFQGLLGDEYVPPSGLRKALQYKIGDWPLYAFLLAIGQIVAANSYQITLLTGKVGQSADDLYVIASIYLGATIIWWTLFRTISSVYVLSTPFLFYGLAFLLLGVAPFCKTGSGTGWVQNVATGFYALASASGSLFFALNFGSEGGTSVTTWSFRACMVQGTQQIYVSALWYWGSSLTKMSNNGATSGSLVMSVPKITIVTVVIALLFWAVGVLLFLGLPNFYRSTPGVVPSFYTSAYRRKIISWFLVVTVIQNYFLASPSGRNWQYLWSSTVAPNWAIAILLIFFFVIVWALMLFFLGSLSVEHSWIIPIFAIGLGAPRWCQMLWGTSGMGLYIPWVGNGVDHESLIGGAILGRALWLWLGVLDALQGVGFGMILLQTLTRLHIAFCLMGAQVIGSIITMVARATSPDQIGPGNVFPNLASSLTGLFRFEFWLCLGLQAGCCIGFFLFFRKEQLFKP